MQTIVQRTKTDFPDCNEEMEAIFVIDIDIQCWNKDWCTLKSRIFPETALIIVIVTETRNQAYIIGTKAFQNKR